MSRLGAASATVGNAVSTKETKPIGVLVHGDRAVIGPADKVIPPHSTVDRTRSRVGG